jgi:hypothetical protein
MAVERVQSDFSYRSTSGGETYYFNVVVDSSSVVSVRNMKTPNGLIQDSYSSLPQSVVEDIQTAIGQVEDLVAQTSAINGIQSFAGETSKAVAFETAMANTNYRVVFSTEDFISVRVTSKETTGFIIETGVTYTGDVGYDVFV